MDVPHSDSPAPAMAPDALAATYRAADRYGWLASDGARLRYACWNASGTRGTVVVLQGRAEFIEKYSTEVMGDLLDRGFAVFAIDLRGQGLSDRPLPDRDKGHVDDFATFVADLDRFLNEIVATAAPRPILGLAHSTSGNVLLRWLPERGAAPLAAAVLVSPMTALYRGRLIRPLLNIVSPFGLNDTGYMVRTGPYDPAMRSFAGNDVTSDERRYRFTDQWFAADPRLRLGGPTCGWLRQALRSIDALGQPGYLERIDVPFMLLSAAKDEVVDVASHGPIVARIRGARHLVIDDAKHEILMETDALRARFWTAFDDFVRPLAP